MDSIREYLSLKQTHLQKKSHLAINIKIDSTTVLKFNNNLLKYIKLSRKKNIKLLELRTDFT